MNASRFKRAMDRLKEYAAEDEITRESLQPFLDAVENGNAEAVCSIGAKILFHYSAFGAIDDLLLACQDGSVKEFIQPLQQPLNY